PGARDRAATFRPSRNISPIHPASAVPPAVAQDAIGTDREDVDAIGIACRRRRLSRERAAERLPRMPALAVPVAVPDLTVLMESEDLCLAARSPRRGG